MKFKKIKDFFATVRNSTIKKEQHVRIPIADAQELQTEISMLLLELKEADKSSTITIFDGGKFK
jgi:hypothetical protein